MECKEAGGVKGSGGIKQTPMEIPFYARVARKSRGLWKLAEDAGTDAIGIKTFISSVSHTVLAVVTVNIFYTHLTISEINITFSLLRANR